MEFFNHNAITNGGVLDFKSALIQVPGDDGGHPSLNEPIFKKIVTMIDEAQESIFMDLFIIGGTLGATIAEHIVETAKKKLASNPKFKVFILHDFGTHFELSNEIMPIFQYIEKKRKEDKKLQNAIVLLQANTQRHPEGVPFAISNLIPRRVKSVEKQREAISYTPTKIDHSKVIVVDGNSDSPKAWVGSKNLSDNDGGYSFDNAVYIHGPAAALIQHSYYKDIEAALTKDPMELQKFPTELIDNSTYHSRKSEILKSFKVTKKKVPYKGSDSVRLTEADVNGTIRNTRNLIIDMIQKAESHIYMEQHFLYDPYIVDALIKRRIQKTQLDIRVLVDHNERFKMGGIPNTVFMRELKSYGIKMRSRMTHSLLAKFPNGSEKVFHQENHRKIISIDGKQLMTGSSNLNPDSLQGTSREFGVQIFNKDQIKKFEAEFLATWEDPDKVMELDVENYQAIMAGHKMSKSFSRLINGIASMLLRAKDDLEGRR
jgi:phosphatidylserine/phosphatidylglycerophosphate/cardiolipin synthase-like enzyme